MRDFVAKNTFHVLCSLGGALWIVVLKQPVLSTSETAVQSSDPARL